MCTKKFRKVALVIVATLVSSMAFSQEEPPPQTGESKAGAEQKAATEQEGVRKQIGEMDKRLQGIEEALDLSVSVRGGNGDPDGDVIKAYQAAIRAMIGQVDGSFTAFRNAEQGSRPGEAFRPWIGDVYTVLAHAKRRALREVARTRSYAQAELILRTALLEVGSSLRGADEHLGGPMTWNLVNQANMILHRLDQVYRRNPTCAVQDKPYRCREARDEMSAQTFVVAFCDQWIDFILTEGYDMDLRYAYPRHVYQYHGRWDTYGSTSHAGLQRRYIQFAFAQMRMAAYGFAIAFPYDERARKHPDPYDIDRRLADLRRRFGNGELHYGRQSWSAVYQQKPHEVFWLGGDPRGFLTVSMMVAGFAKNEMYSNWFGSLYQWPAWELEALERDLYGFLIDRRQLSSFYEPEEAVSATWHLFNDIILNYELARDQECQDWRPYRPPRRDYSSAPRAWDWSGCPDPNRRR